jgi:hypothetical protein
MKKHVVFDHFSSFIHLANATQKETSTRNESLGLFCRIGHFARQISKDLKIIHK